MIAVRPDNLPGRVLRLVCDYPAELPADQIGRLLLPPEAPRPAAPIMTAEQWRDLGQYVAAERLRRAGITRRVSGCLRELTRLGYVARVNGVSLDPYALRLYRELGQSWPAVLAYATGQYLADESIPDGDWDSLSPADIDAGHIDPEDTEYADPATQPLRGDHSLEMLGVLSDVETASVTRLLGQSPSGARKRAYAQLIEAGLIVPPSFRRPTAAGRALVDSWSQEGP